MHLLSWIEGRLCLRELVLPEARLLFGVFSRQHGFEGRLGARARAVDRL